MGLLNQTPQAYYQGDDHGNYQFVSLRDIINQFMMVYVGEDKIIPKAKRLDVAFHAQRALAELSFDTFKSCKAQEITVPPSLQMTLPQDYVNYTKVSWVDSAGIKHLLYPTSKTSNPPNPLQDPDGNFQITTVGTLISGVGGLIVYLDKEYKNILVGMLVSAPGIPINVIVQAVGVFGGITMVTLGPLISGSNINMYVPTYDGDETIVFTNQNGALIIEKESIHILEDLSFVANENKITQSPNTGVANIKIGMIVSSLFFPVGTTVTSVNGDVITTSENATTTVTGTHNDITFYSDKAVSSTWQNYKSGTPHENQSNYQDDTYWPLDGSRYGLDPQHAQVNGSFYIDCISGKIHFSSNISGKTVILDYISDSLGTDGEMQVHKFAEEAMYKWMSHAILSGRANIPEYQINRFKKERFAAIRTAKLRLSNIKLEEITQILRGKSKQIKH